MCPQFDLLALDEIIESYDVETDPVLNPILARVEEKLHADIQNYDAGGTNFGQQLWAHLHRTSLEAQQFITETLGFSQAAGRNIYHANLLQDLGKIHPDFDPKIWDLPHRPTEEERAEKRKHPARGVDLFYKELDKHDLSEEFESHPHITQLVPAIQLFHHERVDGTGLFGKTGDEMGLIIQSICIIDAKDGDMIHRPHQGTQRTEEEALAHLKTGEKYQGAFNSEFLDTYISAH